jgi:hypothetical protein
VERKLDYPFESLGSQRVKNIETPIRLYRVPFGIDGSRRASVARGYPYRPFLLAGFVAVFLLLAGGVLVWKGLRTDTASNTEVASTARASTDAVAALIPLNVRGQQLRWAID